MKNIIFIEEEEPNFDELTPWLIENFEKVKTIDIRAKYSFEKVSESKIFGEKIWEDTYPVRSQYIYQIKNDELAIAIEQNKGLVEEVGFYGFKLPEGLCIGLDDQKDYWKRWWHLYLNFKDLNIF